MKDFVYPTTSLKQSAFDEGKVVTVHHKPEMRYAWDAGVAISRYLEELKQGRLVAAPIQGCNLVRPLRIIHLRRKKFNLAMQTFLELLKEGTFRHLVRQLTADGRLEQIIQDILARRNDPYSASESLILDILGPLG